MEESLSSHTQPVVSDLTLRDLPRLTRAFRSEPSFEWTDQHSGRHIVVRVNDREPDNGIRCIDLTEGAAIALGIFRKGVADVEITALSNRPAIEIAEAPDKSKLSRKLNKTSN